MTGPLVFGPPFVVWCGVWRDKSQSDTTKPVIASANRHPDAERWPRRLARSPEFNQSVVGLRRAATSHAAVHALQSAGFVRQSLLLAACQ